MLKTVIRAYGLNPEEVLTKEALSMPNRTVVSTTNFEESQIKILRKILRETITAEIRQ